MTDALMTRDGQLHASQSPVAGVDPRTGLWSLELLCGPFVYLRHAPFAVEWLVSDW